MQKLKDLCLEARELYEEAKTILPAKEAWDLVLLCLDKELTDVATTLLKDLTPRVPFQDENIETIDEEGERINILDVAPELAAGVLPEMMLKRPKK